MKFRNQYLKRLTKPIRHRFAGGLNRSLGFARDDNSRFCYVLLIQMWVGLSLVIFGAGGGCITQEKIAQEFQSKRRARAAALLSKTAEPEMIEPEVISGPLSLADGIELALIHNKDVQTAKQQLIEAQGQMTEAIATALPSATFSGTGQRNDNTGLIAGPKETYQLQLLARQPLYLGGLTGAALDAAAAFSYMSQQLLRQSIQAVKLQVRQQYLQVLLARELARVSEQAQRDAEEFLLDTQKKLKFGTGTRFDVLRAEVRLRNVQAELIQRQNEVRLAIASLLNTLGVSQLSDVELTDQLEYQKNEASNNPCMLMALQHRPELLIGEAMIRLAKDNVISEQSGNRPKVFLQGMYQRSYPGAAANFKDLGKAFGGGGEDNGEDEEGGGMSFPSFDRVWDRTMFGGIMVEWSIFDGFLTDGRVTKAKAELRRQEIALSKMEQQVQLETTQALLNLESSDQFVQSQSGNVDNAEEALRLAQVRYREGAGTSLDVISAEVALAQARSAYNSAVHSYQVAQLMLEWATGTLGEDLPVEIPERTKESGETDKKAEADQTDR